ncbi:MAG: tetratricopeptide repeat protein [Planctomycetes bacterium]|nr:tetratricopeptide repeat protein [Planctomycetota bacterium]
MIEFVHELLRRQQAPVAPVPAPRWPTWLTMFALALVYVPAAMRAQLLQFDDIYFFGPAPNNPQFVAGLWTVLTQPIANAWLPVSHASLWLDWKLTGTAAWWPHLHSLLLHALCAVVLTRLLLQCGARALVAHCVGALFVVHPALCESVAWASGRKDVLSGLFVLLALFQTVRFAHRPGAGRLLLIALLTALAMAAKPTAVVLPLLGGAVLVMIGGPRQRWWACAVQLLVAGALAVVHQRIAAEQGTMAAGDAASRLAQVPGAFLHYLLTAVWPTRLNVLYPEVDTLAAFRAAEVPGAIALGAFVVVGGALVLFRRTRLVGAAMSAFVLALLPFNTAWPASSIAAADRYLYLALPWLVLAVVAALAKLNARGPWLAAAAGVPLLWLCGARAADFEDDERLWQASIAVDDDNAVAHFNLASARLSQRVVALDRVRPELEAAVRAARYPIHELRARMLLVQFAMAEADYAAAARHGRAAIAAAEAQLLSETTDLRRGQAADLLRKARLAAIEPLRFAGDDAMADEVLAALRAESPDEPDVIAYEAMRELRARQPELLALADAGKAPRLADEDPAGLLVDERLGAARDRVQQAIGQLQQQHRLAEAQELLPVEANLWLAQGLWDRARERVLAAVRSLRKARELDEQGVAAHLELARMLRERGQFADAEQYAREGLQRRPDPHLMQELAHALVAQHRFDEAEIYLDGYLRAYPDDAGAKKILANLLVGRAYEKLSNPAARAEVRRLIDRAVSLNPNETKAHLVLGRLAREERHFREAVAHLEQAHRLLPDFVDAQQQLAEALAAYGYQQFVAGLLPGTVDAWLRCIEVAPADFDLDDVRARLVTVGAQLEKRGVERLAAGDLAGAEADFRGCLRIDPDHHGAAWNLATVLYRKPDADLAEVAELCRRALAWQRSFHRDASRQAYLLATTLDKAGKHDEALAVAKEYVAAPDADADAAVLSALQRLAAQ